ncbi:MAG TPA: tetratricopeptide repeat protein [Thermoanaerobaculia bacterium]|nr:tetratricopeptide repeat protein [Thermoanaerobaculia bacterium]
MTRSGALLALLLLLPSLVAAQTRPAASNELQKARALLSEQRAAEAEQILRRAIEANPSRVDYRIALAEALVQQKRLTEAEEVLLAVRRNLMSYRESELLLAQIWSWQGRFEEAAAAFDAILAEHPDDTRAREGRAAALYWSGDWPRAADEYRRLLAIQPQNETARQHLGEIEQLAAATGEAGLTYSDDDQPYRRIRSWVSYSPRARSLTRFRVDAGSYYLEASTQDLSKNAPFGGAWVARSFPRSKFAAEAWVRAQNFPDGETKILGGGLIRRTLGAHSHVSLSLDQRELLYTTTSLPSHPYVSAATLRWDLQQPGGWYAAAFAESLRYFDGNRGVSLGGYAAAPLFRTAAVTFWLGAGASYRDTDQTRFRLESISSTPRPGGGFTYHYRGVYDPYWTPVEATEARLVTVLGWSARAGLALRIHADGGVAHERVLGFGPASGTTPIPTPGAGFFEREIHPWRAGLELTRPLGRVGAVTVAYEHFVTAFYVADEATVRLSRRF